VTDDARALIVRQPWAALIAAEIKRVENRSWPLPDRFAGPLVIHAGLKDDTTGWESAAVREALGDTAIVYGAMIAVAAKVTCHRDAGCCADRWGEPGAWHWVLEGITALPEPLPASGRQGLWRLPEARSARLPAPRPLADEIQRGQRAELGGVNLAAPRTR
jgi:hypothetical protein